MEITQKYGQLRKQKFEEYVPEDSLKEAIYIMPKPRLR